MTPGELEAIPSLKRDWAEQLGPNAATSRRKNNTRRRPQIHSLALLLTGNPSQALDLHLRHSLGCMRNKTR